MGHEIIFIAQSGHRILLTGAMYGHVFTQAIAITDGYLTDRGGIKTQILG